MSSSDQHAAGYESLEEDAVPAGSGGVPLDTDIKKEVQPDGSSSSSSSSSAAAGDINGGLGVAPHRNGQVLPRNPSVDALFKNSHGPMQYLAMGRNVGHYPVSFGLGLLNNPLMFQGYDYSFTQSAPGLTNKGVAGGNGTSNNGHLNGGNGANNNNIAVPGDSPRSRSSNDRVSSNEKEESFHSGTNNNAGPEQQNDNENKPWIPFAASHQQHVANNLVEAKSGGSPHKGRIHSIVSPDDETSSVHMINSPASTSTYRALPRTNHLQRSNSRTSNGGNNGPNQDRGSHLQGDAGGTGGAAWRNAIQTNPVSSGQPNFSFDDLSSLSTVTSRDLRTDEGDRLEEGIRSKLEKQNKRRFAGRKLRFNIALIGEKDVGKSQIRNKMMENFYLVKETQLPFGAVEYLYQISEKSDFFQLGILEGKPSEEYLLHVKTRLDMSSAYMTKQRSGSGGYGVSKRYANDLPDERLHVAVWVFAAESFYRKLPAGGFGSRDCSPRNKDDATTSVTDSTGLDAMKNSSLDASTLQLERKTGTKPVDGNFMFVLKEEECSNHAASSSSAANAISSTGRKLIQPLSEKQLRKLDEVNPPQHGYSSKQQSLASLAGSPAGNVENSSVGDLNSDRHRAVPELDMNAVAMRQNSPVRRDASTGVQSATGGGSSQNRPHRRASKESSKEEKPKSGVEMCLEKAVSPKALAQMKRLSKMCALVPVISKVDTVTTRNSGVKNIESSDLETLREALRGALNTSGVEAFNDWFGAQQQAQQQEKQKLFAGNKSAIPEDEEATYGDDNDGSTKPADDKSSANDDESGANQSNSPNRSGSNPKISSRRLRKQGTADSKSTPDASGSDDLSNVNVHPPDGPLVASWRLTAPSEDESASGNDTWSPKNMIAYYEPLTVELINKLRSQVLASPLIVDCKSTFEEQDLMYNLPRFDGYPPTSPEFLRMTLIEGCSLLFIDKTTALSGTYYEQVERQLRRREKIEQAHHFLMSGIMVAAASAAFFLGNRK